MPSTASLFTINSCVYIYIYICIHIHKDYSRLVRQLGIHIGLLQHERSPTPNTRSIHIDSTAIHCIFNHNCVSGLHVHTILGVFQMCTPNKRTVQIDSTAIYHIDNHNCVLFFCRRVCMTQGSVHVSRRALFRI